MHQWKSFDLNVEAVTIGENGGLYKTKTLQTGIDHVNSVFRSVHKILWWGVLEKGGEGVNKVFYIKKGGQKSSDPQKGGQKS